MSGLRHIGHHETEGCALETILGQWPNGDLHRHLRSVAGLEHHLGFRARFAGPFHQQPERYPVFGGEKAAKGTAHHLLQRVFDHPGKALIGVEDHLVRRQRQRPFVHGFDEQAVGALGAFEREYLGAFFARDHHRVHLAGADGAEGFLGVGEAGAELGKFAGRSATSLRSQRMIVPRAVEFIGASRSGDALRARDRPRSGTFLAGSFQSAMFTFLIKSNSTNRPVMFIRLPMKRRSGGGNSMMSVGVATIWFLRASLGCW